jgi:threonine dehydrogenase-like Zn-dependent dehydrogenase
VRRELASRCGAEIVVDPAHESPYDAGDRGHLDTLPAAIDLLISTMEKLQRLPVPWQHSWRMIDALGVKPKHPVIFECVGMPGVLDSIIASAPLFSRVIGVGVCMGEDRIRPSMAINKEIDLRFVVGYTPLEFRDTLHMLADGNLDATPLLTGLVGLDGVPAAFQALAKPERHAKILIDPQSHAVEPGPPPSR